MTKKIAIVVLNYDDEVISSDRVEALIRVGLKQFVEVEKFTVLSDLE